MFFPLTLDRYWQGVLFFPVGIFVLLALGLNIVVGQAGLLDLGYVAFYAVGAYTTAVLTTTHHWATWGALPVAIAVVIHTSASVTAKCTSARPPDTNSG